MSRRARGLALAAALAVAGCSGPAGPTEPAEPATPATPRAVPPAGAGSDPDAVEIEAALGAVAPAERGEARELAQELATDWRREAGGDRDAAQIRAVLRDELRAKLGARAAPEDRLELLRAEVYDRRARALGRRSLALGQAVIDGGITDARARAAGEAILREVAPLAARVRALRDPEAARALGRDLEEISLEAVYAIERGAMSRRLSDYQAARGSAPRVE